MSAPAGRANAPGSGILLVLLLLSACAESTNKDCPVLTVFAAQSLEPALSELSGPDVRFSFAASGQLLRQLELGAPAGLFLSAGQTEADAAAKLKGAVGQPIPFARNQLVLAVPVGNPAGLAALADVARVRRLAVGRDPVVPAGRYAREALELAGLHPALLEAESAPQAVAYVRTGEADAGLVYESDAKEARLQVVAPAPTRTPIVYPAVIFGGACEAKARSFLDRLRAPEGRTVLGRHGLR